MVIKTNSNSRTLVVLMNGFLIGHLRKAEDGGLSFQYHDSWLTTPGKRPISLHLPTEPSLHSGDSVFNFFDNLLPDNPAILKHIQKRFGVNSNHPFDLLEAIGRDCIGAIQLYPERESGFTIRAIVGTPLNHEALVKRVASSRTAPLGMDKEHEEFRISLAGAQDKTGLLWHNNQWYSPEGTTPTTHIIKLPIGKIDYNDIDLSNSVDNEWLCLKLLGLYGLPVANAERLTIGDSTVLAVERFDRRLSADQQWIMRLPQEDMCQALGFSSGKKYEADGGPGIPEIMKLLEKSDQAAQDRTNFMKANLSFWLMAAPDGHAKNFSIFILPNGKFTLTPIYDVLSLYPQMASREIARQKIKMAMSLRGSKRYYNWFGSALSVDHLLTTAKQCDFDKGDMLKLIEETLGQTEQILKDAQALLPDDFPSDVSQAIFEGIRQSTAKLKKQLTEK